MDFASAIKEIHFPSSSDSVIRARDRLAFGELFFRNSFGTRTEGIAGLRVRPSSDLRESFLREFWEEASISLDEERLLEEGLGKGR